MRCAVIGLGEAGGVFAAALASAGHEVLGYDPADKPTPAGVVRVDDVSEAVRGASYVLVLTAASVAPAVAASCAPYLAEGACYADFTSAAPAVMERLGREVPGFADVAILGPVPLHGHKVPLMVSGPGASALAGLMRPLGTPVDVLDAPPGAAMARKLLRSVFMKGLALVICEAVEAGRAAGDEEWIRAEIARQLAGDGQAVIDRFLTGTATHAVRRAQEMRDTGEYLDELGVAAEMTRAAESSLRRIAG
jgi:3-hydroxyisobutyrate dehydrogenase